MHNVKYGAVLTNVNGGILYLVETNGLHTLLLHLVGII